MKCKRTSDGRKLDHHTLQVMRQQAVRAVREGQRATSVAAAMGGQRDDRFPLAG